MAQAGQTIKHYHANNGGFSDNGFFNAINEKDQKLTFFGVGAHHQNGTIENRNKILTTSARTLLPPSIILWPQMIDEIFWTFDIKAVLKILNSLQIDLKFRTPEFILHGVEVEDIPVKSYHMLFCPIYTLDARL